MKLEFPNKKTYTFAGLPFNQNTTELEARANEWFKVLIEAEEAKAEGKEHTSTFDHNQLIPLIQQAFRDSMKRAHSADEIDEAIECLSRVETFVIFQKAHQQLLFGNCFAQESDGVETDKTS